MAIEAVASVVLQKLTDMLKEKSIISKKVIVVQLEEIKKDLESLKGFFIDAEYKRTDKEIKEWTDKYLKSLYHAEDAIESFALRFARQRKRLGFLMNHALFLKNFTACRKLSRKVKRIKNEIQRLKCERPGSVEDASLKSKRLLPCHDYEQDQSIRSFGTHFDIEDGVAEKVEEQEAENIKEQDMELGREACPGVASHPIANGRHHWDMASPNLEGCTERLTNSSNLLVLRDFSLYRERSRQSTLMYSYSYVAELEMVGFQSHVDSLVDSLIHGACDVVSIVGEMGSGKTTLARAVCGNRKIKECFKSCWVTVPKESNAIELLLKLLKQVDPKEQGGLHITEELLRNKLSERLSDGKYLIILDDVSRPEVWDYLKNSFPSNRNGSKIIITTCDQQVASHADSQPHRLVKLGQKDSWSLFLKKVGLKDPEDPRHTSSQDDLMQKISQEELRRIVFEVCNCLPLDIVLLGSLLSTKRGRDFDEWSQRLSSQGKLETMESLSISYNDLHESLKLCLLYMVLFPKEYDIPVRRLLRLWQAEGFVKRPGKVKNSPEDVAQEYFDDLVKRSLIQVSKERSDGSPKRCRLLGVIHDYLSPKALDISLFHVHSKSNACGDEGQFGVRRFVEYTDIKNCPLNPSKLQRLRSYLSFNSQKKDTPAKEVGNLLRSIIGNGLPLLRVLDLEGVYKPSLPNNLGDFFHLMYLGLRWTFLETLPESVGNLHYLETLDVKHTYINTLPCFIWKLKHLRHLNLNKFRLDVPRHLRSSLPQLLTLWGLFLDNKSQVKGGLSKLVHLRELGITFNLTSSEELLDWISKLTDLQSLRLRSKDDIGRPSELILKPLTELKRLSHLNLMGNLTKLPDKDDFPEGLKVLTLSVSQLIADPMPILGQLPSLTVLRLLANSYLGETMDCQGGGFRQLRVLKLWMLKKLKKWDLKEGTMERLKELNIRCCDRLRTIPRRLLEQESFKELTLTNMPKEFTDQVKEIKSPHVLVTSKNYEFTPLPWENIDASSN